MKKYYDVIVAGGGASGMMAAYQACMGKKSVLLIEKNDRLGKKILETGNGRCNLTNLKMNSSCYGRETAGFAMQVIGQFNERQLMDFFTKHGLLLHDRQGYVYPNCDQAAAVNDLFARILCRDHLDLLLGCDVLSAHKEGNEFVVKTSGGSYQSRKLILAMGSKAHPKSGSDGRGYELLQQFGHTLTTPLPALTALVSDFAHCREVSGVRADGHITCIVEGDAASYEERGEVQLTDYGISGIPVFQISRYAVQAVHQKKKVHCFIDFLPDYAKEDLVNILKTKCLTQEGTILGCVSGLINSKITRLIIKQCGLLEKQAASSLNEKKILEIVRYMKEFDYPITGYRSFDYGQICQGGVKVTEISPDTMESTVVVGLYPVGELVDVDGICGGYNLQWAFSSGYIAGKAAGQ